MLSFYFSFYKQTPLIKGETIFYSVLIEIQIYGQGSRILPWVKCQIFLEALFLCNNINSNLNKNFHTYLIYYSFKPLFLFFQISEKI